MLCLDLMKVTVLLRYAVSFKSAFKNNFLMFFLKFNQGHNIDVYNIKNKQIMVLIEPEIFTASTLLMLFSQVHVAFFSGRKIHI